MAEKPMFDTVRFGGFDKEEVLSFISETLEISQKKEQESEKKFHELSDKIDLLNKQAELLTKRNLELEQIVGDPQALKDASGKVIASHYDERTISQAVLRAQNACNAMMNETQYKCRVMLERAKVEAAGVRRGGIELDDAERRYQNILEKVSTMNEVLALMEEKVHVISESLQALESSMLNEGTPHGNQ